MALSSLLPLTGFYRPCCIGHAYMESQPPREAYGPALMLGSLSLSTFWGVGFPFESQSSWFWSWSPIPRHRSTGFVTLAVVRLQKLQKLAIFIQMPFLLFKNPNCKRTWVWVPFFPCRKTEQFPMYWNSLAAHCKLCLLATPQFYVWEGYTWICSHAHPSSCSPGTLKWGVYLLLL